ncbi:sphinganine-1-phosphate aldolase [Coprinellus micaceus]|uniref:sphinganine-1-phosphate aldolase n=1 Tax=Coprinellus micaceus TaxID=71717 RepID=A0A4Y7RND8_COPMI|nr:sphinganine-1-phosphate aldolase [Coprinellus micaceus]
MASTLHSKALALTIPVTYAKELLGPVLGRLDVAKSALFYYILAIYARKAYWHLRARGVTASVKEVYLVVSQFVVRLVLRLPSMQKKVTTEMGKARLDIENKLVPKGPNVTRHLALPDDGKSLEWILAEMEKMDVELNGQSGIWNQGKLSGAVYHGGEDLQKIITAAYDRYCVSNPLHPDVFPAVRKMEAEIVAMVLKLYNGPDTGCGVVTSGGTESIIMALKTYRDWAKKVKGVTEPEIIIPASAHAAFDKGAAYFKIKVHVIPVDGYTRKVDLKRVKRAINPNTILLVGSCINYPDGTQDDIAALSELALKHNLGLHVDCCLGSFIVPFLEPAGLANGDANGKYKLTPFDFRLKGVTSISCDTHKYGFAPKGTSVIMYRTPELRRFQYYVYAEWVGGVYASPSMSGSRPGALIAGAWAVLQHVGTKGYLESCRSIVLATRQIADAITNTIPELYVLGDPPASVVAFASKHPQVSALEVGDAMSKRGWHLAGISNPAACHIAVTRLTVPVVDAFIADLKDAVQEAKLAPSGTGSMVAVYGLGKSSAVGPEMVGELAASFIDTLYKA